MSEIVSGVLAGGWGLLVGWILPAAINIAVVLFLLPDLAGVKSLTDLSQSSTGVVVLVAALLLGLTMAALQTPLYRVLEGYLGWPNVLYRWGQQRQLARKRLLVDRTTFARLIAAERDGTLDEAGKAGLEAMRAHPVLRRYGKRDALRGAVHLGLLHERLRRFPVDDESGRSSPRGWATRSGGSRSTGTTGSGWTLRCSGTS